MLYPRLPRFRRASPVAPIQLTERDREIIRLVYRNRFLRSTHLQALLGGSSQQLLRRLQLLYHQGFLERPRAQLDYYYRTGSRPIVYGLGTRGVEQLRQEGLDKPGNIHWAEKDRSVGTIYLEHALSVSDVLVRIEAACRQSGRARLLLEDEIVREDGRPLGFVRWRVQVDGGRKLGLIPDRLFALEFQNDQGIAERICFFLEADRGTMPVLRRGLSQSSMYRKLLSYAATWQQAVVRSVFGIERFRVVIVTTGPERLASLLEACSRLKRGHGLFLLADIGDFNRHDPLSFKWQTGRVGEFSTLLD